MVCIATERGVFRASASSVHFFNAKISVKRNEKEIFMDNYKEMYLILFNAITDAIKILEEAQKKTEEIYINAQKTDYLL